MNETWKSLKGLIECGDYYEVSDLGSVRSLTRYDNMGRRSVGRNLKKTLDGCGYCVVRLYHNGEEKKYGTHRLIAIAFIPNPENKPEVNHKDGNKLNNHIDNLEWNTKKENVQHAYDNGLNKTEQAKGEDNHRAVLKEKDVLKIRNMYNTGSYTYKELANIYNVSRTAIANIVKLRTWKHI